MQPEENSNKKIYLIVGSVLLVLLVVTVVFFAFVFLKQNKNESAESSVATTTRREIPEPNVKVSKYILGGKVTAVNNNEISITLKRLFAGDNGNYLDVDNKIVRVLPSTQIVVGKFINKRYAEVPGSLSDIKVGQNITLYSAENIKVMPIFSPFKLIISQ